LRDLGTRAFSLAQRRRLCANIGPTDGSCYSLKTDTHRYPQRLARVDFCLSDCCRGMSATCASLNFHRFMVTPLSQTHASKRENLAQIGPIFRKQVAGYTSGQNRTDITYRRTYSSIARSMQECPAPPRYFSEQSRRLPSITVAVHFCSCAKACSATSVLAAFFAKTSAFLARWATENEAQL
jgi:hypothetical protein